LWIAHVLRLERFLPLGSSAKRWTIEKRALRPRIFRLLVMPACAYLPLMQRKQRLFIPVSNDEKAMVLSLTEDSGLTVAAHVRQMIREQYRTKVRTEKKEPLTAT